MSGSGFDLDLRYGHEGERRVLDLLGIEPCRFEVKRERKAEARVFVELLQDPTNTGRFRRSGLSVTEAEYWTFVKVGDFGDLFVFVTPAALREQIRKMESRGMQPRPAGRDGNNPTKGHWVDLAKLFSPW
jgi:hypothetical protein